LNICLNTLHFAFVDLEKAFDRETRKVTRWAVRKMDVEDWLVNAVMVMYEGTQTVVDTMEQETASLL